MNYTICVSVLLCIFCLNTFGQSNHDKIIKTDNTYTEGKVLEVNPEEVKYKPAGASVSTVLILPINKISHIVYANGYVEEYNPQTFSASEEQIDLIYLTDGTSRDAIIQEVAQDTLYYQASKDGPLVSLSRSNIEKVVFANGYEEYYNKQEATQFNAPDILYTTDNTEREVIISSVGEDQVSFRDYYHPEDAQISLPISTIARIEYANGEIQQINGKVIAEESTAGISSSSSEQSSNITNNHQLQQLEDDYRAYKQSPLTGD